MLIIAEYFLKISHPISRLNGRLLAIRKIMGIATFLLVTVNDTCFLIDLFCLPVEMCIRDRLCNYFLSDGHFMISSWVNWSSCMLFSVSLIHILANFNFPRQFEELSYESNGIHSSNVTIKSSSPFPNCVCNYLSMCIKFIVIACSVLFFVFIVCNISF